MPNLKFALAFCACTLTAVPAMACYTVINAANQVVYSGIDAPIDMSYQISQRLQSAFPGGHLIFDNSTVECPRVDMRPGAQLPASNSPASMALAAAMATPAPAPAATPAAKK